MSKSGLVKAMKDANKIKKELANHVIEAEEKGLVIAFTGEMKLEKIYFENDGKKLLQNEKELFKAFKIIYNKATVAVWALASKKLEKNLKEFKDNI